MSSVAGLQAAPTTTASDAASTESESAAARRRTAAEISGMNDGQGDSKTIRMLLELQQTAPPPVERNSDLPTAQRPKQPNQPATAGGVTAEAGAPTIKEAEPQPSLDWRSGLPGRNVNSTRTPEAGSTSNVGRLAAKTAGERTLADDEVNVKALLPATLVNFLRQNREWVLLGSAGFLGLVWLAAAALTQRRQH